jgi:hypothetical protein
MRELWSWEIDNQTYYFPESGGDADRLPDGNTIGVFGNKALVLNEKSPTIITEVTKDGEIAWELTINGVNNTYFWVHLVERFYEQPLVQINEKILNLETNQLHLNLTVWSGYKIDAFANGILKVKENNKIIFEQNFEFLPQWQPQNIQISLSEIKSNPNRINLIIETEDGIQTVVEIFNSGWKTRNTVLLIVIPAFVSGLIVLLIYLEKKYTFLTKILRR